MTGDDRDIVDYKLGRFEDTLDKLVVAILGDGQQTGLAARVVALESALERAQWLSRTLLGAVILLSLKALWSAVSGQ